jgi:hypothetical protein
VQVVKYCRAPGENGYLNIKNGIGSVFPTDYKLSSEKCVLFLQYFSVPTVCSNFENAEQKEGCRCSIFRTSTEEI